MNLAQLRLEVRSALDGVDDDFWSDAEINRWLNEAVWTMCSIAQPLQHVYQFNTVAGQQEYPMPFEAEEVFGLSLSNGGSLRNLDRTDVRMVQLGSQSSGVPSRFYLRLTATQVTLHNTSGGITLEKFNTDNASAGGLVLGFDPVPSSVLQANVSFFSRHFQMTSDADVPLIAPEYQRGIIAYATALGKEKEGFDEEAQIARARFAEYSEKLRTKMISRGWAAGFPSVILPDDDAEPFGYTKIYS